MHDRKFMTLCVAMAAAAALTFSCRRHAPEAVAVAEKGAMEIWSVYDGTIESRNMREIGSLLDGAATIVELAPDGAVVKKDAVLVRFDQAALERDLVRLERDYALAAADIGILTNARIPMALAALESKLSSAQRQMADEARALEADRELARDKLIAALDLEAQEARWTEARSLAAGLEEELRLTKAYVHPAERARAEAALIAAAQELAMARQRLSNSVIRASADGIVAYKALPVGGEFRPVRAGDTVYRNQAFMALPDMNRLLMRCDVPEGELHRVHVGAPALVRPLAYPDGVVTGRIESVGAMAQVRIGLSGGDRYFNVVIRLDGLDERLRSGMTARARVLTYAQADVLQIQRRCVWWEDGAPRCRRIKGGAIESVSLRLGMAGDTHYEVLDGLRPGDRVLVP